MAQSWKELRDRVLRALDDASRVDPTWSDDDLKDYLAFGLEALAQHTARQVVWDYTPTAAVTSVELPDDLLAIGPVWFPDRQLLVKVELEPGMIFTNRTVSSTSYPQGYFEWPDGTLQLTRSLSASETLTVHYWGYWKIPREENDPLGTPRWAQEALYWYMISRAFTKPGVSQAQLGQWDTKRDAGQPEHNPPRVYAEWCERKFYELLAQHPAQDRTRWQQL